MASGSNNLSLNANCLGVHPMILFGSLGFQLSSKLRDMVPHGVVVGAQQSVPVAERNEGPPLPF